MRRTLPALALCVALLSSSAAVQAAPEPPPGKTFPYGWHPRQTLTVYGDGGPALLILHGGSWVRDTDWSGWARWFAGQGFTVYDTDYRLATDAAWPAQRDDVLAALRWVERRLGERPLVLGSSAGGHLALSAGAYGAGGTRVRGVVALSPVASPYRAWVDGGRPAASSAQRGLRRAARLLAGCSPDRGGQPCWNRWGDLAATSHASGPDDAPMLLAHSAGDFVPVAHSDELARSQGVLGMEDATVCVEPGAAHGGVLLKSPKLRRLVLGWLREHSA
ncbi:alpha/beta hydrolase [Streptomyces sp. NPDC059037]|uniref:alpha/beta hydrolase n=1 Tax=Streptomyces sp. NPDC059037 TaxID=3346710 RepID=UPI0036786F74